MKKLIRNSIAEFLIFTVQAGEDSIEVRVEDETVWLTQKLIAELFNKGRSTITEHLKNIFIEGELEGYSVCRELRHTGRDGKSYNTKFYNLDAIISVGYRVNSKRATQFRQWATQVLKEFAIKGFVLDNKRLENGALLATKLAPGEFVIDRDDYRACFQLVEVICPALHHFSTFR